jgi:tRNA threonylcarbamoyladenosine biosynthesis protein TsaB
MAPLGRILVVDTATPVAVVGVVDVAAGFVVVAEATLAETQRHAERLPAAVADVLAAAGAVDAVVVGVGPGSFIGVRTGIAFVAGLCRARGLPLLGTSTLAALACSIDVDADADADVGLVAVIDAKRGEHYVQRFVRRGVHLAAVGPPQAARPGDIHVGVGDVVVGVGGAGAAARVGPSVVGLARAAAQGALVAPVLPLYVRAPDAKLPSVDPSRALKDLGGAL